MVIIIENQHEDGATWGISFDGYNPDDEFFTPCKSEKEAVKLQRLINDHLRKEYKKHLNDVTTVDVGGTPTPLERRNHD